MEAHRDDLVVILAGYKERMDVFFRSNPGMASRIAHHIDFPDFSLGDLTRIAERMLADEEYEGSHPRQLRRSASTSACGCSSPASPTRAASGTPSTAYGCGKRAGR